MPVHQLVSQIKVRLLYRARVPFLFIHAAFEDAPRLDGRG
jgi:hypothetical protein